CQESGLTVQEWCNRNNVNIKTYYYHLRKAREKIVEQIPVPIGTTAQISKEEPEIKIQIGEAVVKIPEGISEKTITAVLRVLKC
ncbi:MAG: IS66 family insertion sequence element accessory protein TnpB, partial [Ruminococcus sp.]|nr:IS66 family insertion sequence element accessory protein TnpB [Ruminococcus sp.]